MNSSQSIKEISVALVKAQSKMGAAVKGAANPYYKSKYSDLNSVIEACKEHLNAEGISVLQPVISDASGDYVETVLMHTSGEFFSSSLKLRTLKENDMQAYGSSISYARRYGLQSMVFIPAVDDDAESTMAREKKAKLKESSAATVFSSSAPVVGTITTTIHELSAESKAAATAPAKKPTFRKSTPVLTTQDDI